MKENYIKIFSIPGDCVNAFLIWWELRTGNTLVIDLFVAIILTGSIIYSLFIFFINRAFKKGGF
jgi:hypothetical protein